MKLALSRIGAKPLGHGIILAGFQAPGRRCLLAPLLASAGSSEDACRSLSRSALE